MSTENDKQFRKLLLTISQHITQDDLQDMKFVCMNEIPPARSEAITKPRDLFMALMSAGHISEHDTSFLDDLLASISAENLRAKVRDYWASRTGPSTASHTVKCKGLPCKIRNFTGREESVSSIVNYLTGEDCLSVIIAAPGYGKSALATESGYAMYESKQFSVLYVSLRELDSLEGLASEILIRLDISPGNQLVFQAQNALVSLETDTLLILDNAEDLQRRETERKFKKFLTYLGVQARHLRMLVTTRKKIGLLSFEYQEVRLVPLDTASSARLLDILAPEAKELVNCEELGEACGGIPLYLRIVASFVRNGYSPIALLEKLRNNPVAVLKMSDPDSEEYRSDLLRFLQECLSSDLLTALIQVSIFPKAFSAHDAKVVIKDHDSCQTLLSRLVGHALLNLCQGTYVLHPFIQSLCRVEADAVGLKEDAQNAEHLFNSHYLGVLEKTQQEFMECDKSKSAMEQFNASKLNILQAVYNSLKPEQKEDAKTRCLSVCTAATNFLGKALTSDEFHKLFAKCSETALGMDDHKRYSDSLTSLGFRHMIDSTHLKLNIRALDTLELAYKIQNKLSSGERECEEHAHCKSKLGLCYVLQGESEAQVERGVTLVEEAIALRKRLSHPVFIAAGYGEKANTLRHRGQYEQAIKLWKEENLRVYSDELGDHPFTATTLNWLGICYMQLEQFEQAADYKQKALRMRKMLLGPNHQDVLRSNFELAQVLSAQGKHEEALAMLNNTVLKQEQILGCHPHTVKTYKEIGALHEKLGDDELAKSMCTKADEYECSLDKRQIEYQRQSSIPESPTTSPSREQFP